MMSRLWRHMVRGRGATATETIILLVLVAMVILSIVKMFSNNLGTKVNKANSAVASLSTEDPDARRVRENGKKAWKGQNGAAAPAGEQQPAAGGSKGNGAAAAANAGKQGAPTQTAAGTPTVQEGCGGFNPFVIPIALGLAGLLGYVIMKTKKG